MNKIATYVGIVETKECKEIKTSDINLPKNLKILNKKRTLLTLNTNKYKIKILIQIKL